MGGVRAFIILVMGAAIGGAFILAHRVSQETGKGFPEAFADVPDEARRVFADLKARSEEAVEQGREAYHHKQTEIDDILAADGDKG